MKINYQDISQKIIEAAETDQNMRFGSQQGAGKWDKTIDTINSKMLEKIIEYIGWPTISKVGKEASYAAWLIAQHADHDCTFQSRCLKLMKECDSHDIDPINLAYLQDRVLVNQGKKQIYGTQFYENKAKKIIPRPVKDIENIERIRKVVGLEPFEIYKQKMNGTYKAIKESAKIGRFYRVT